MDKGGADLIADGRIQVKSGHSLKHFTSNSVVLSDGTELPADLVVFASVPCSHRVVCVDLHFASVRGTFISARQTLAFWAWTSSTRRKKSTDSTMKASSRGASVQLVILE